MIEPRLVRAVDPVASAAAFGVVRSAEVVNDIDEAEQAVRRRLALLRDGGRTTHAAAGVDSEIAAELRRLAVDLKRIERVRDHATDRVAEGEQARGAVASGLALHPETVLAASQAVLDAEAAVGRAQSAAFRPRDSVADDAVPQPERRGWRRLLPRRRRRVAPPPPDPEQALREADLAHAERLLDEANRRWTSLTGPGTNPHDLESALRGHDPQQAYVARWAEAAPALAALQALHRAARARWRVLWATLGIDEPAPADAEPALDGLATSAARTAAAEARERVAALHRPLVLVEPSAWPTQWRLARVLASLPDHTEVVSVERLRANWRD